MNRKYRNTANMVIAIFFIILVFILIRLFHDKKSVHSREFHNSEFSGVLDSVYYLKCPHFVIRTNLGLLDDCFMSSEFEETVELGDSIFKLKGINCCKIVKEDGRSFCVAFYYYDAYEVKFKSCDCNIQESHRSDNRQKK